MSTSWEAAREEDEVSHSAAIATKAIFAALGAAAGAAIGIAATLLISPTGVGIAVGVLGTIALAAEGATLGGEFGEWVGSKLPRIPTGKIKDGAATVLVGKDKRPHARIEDPVQCMGGPMAGAGTAMLATMFFGPLGALYGAYSMVTETMAHMSAKIVWGCMTVGVEGRAAARVGCKTDCGAEVSKGELTVFLGGPLGALPGMERPSETASVDSVIYVFGWVGTVASVVAAGITVAVAGTIGAGLLFALTIFGASSKLVADIEGDQDAGYASDAGGWRKAGKGLQDIAKQKSPIGRVVYGIKYAVEMLIPAGKIDKRSNEIEEKSGPPMPIIQPSR